MPPLSSVHYLEKDQTAPKKLATNTMALRRARFRRRHPRSVKSRLRENSLEQNKIRWAWSVGPGARWSMQRRNHTLLATADTTAERTKNNEIKTPSSTSTLVSH